MANENRLCTLHILRSALTLQTELLTSSPISPNNQAHPFQQKQEAIENVKKKKQMEGKICVLGTNSKPSGEEIQKQKQKKMCLPGTNRKPSGEERA